MKKFTSKLLALALTLSLCSSMSFSASATGSQMQIINEEIDNNTQYITQLAYQDNIYYYYTETDDRVLSASFALGNDANIYIKDKQTGNIFDKQIIAKQTLPQTVADIASHLDTSYSSFTFSGSVNDYIKQKSTPAPTSASMVNNLMISKHGQPYNGKVLVRKSGPNSSYAELTEALTYWNGGRLTEYFLVGTTLINIAVVLGLPVASIQKILGSYVVQSVLVANAEIDVFHAEAQWTKSVYVNNTYQYYSGKDMKYAVAFCGSRNTGLISRGNYTHPDFNNNSLLIQKGFDNYFM